MQKEFTKQELTEGAEWLVAFGERLDRLRQRLSQEPEIRITIEDKETGRKLAATTSEITSSLQTIVRDMTRRIAVEPLEDVITNPVLMAGGEDMIILAHVFARELDEGRPVRKAASVN